MMHDWDLTPKQAVALQRRLAARVLAEDDLGPVRRVAGADVHLGRHGREGRAAVAVLRLPELELVEQTVVSVPVRFPYVPGLLSFREAPPILEALNGLSRPPDLLLCDGQGVAHPRRFGLACHLGLWTGIPSLGVAKSRLTGAHAEVPARRGGWTPLYGGDEVIGAVLRTRIGVKPVFVSVGHRVSLPTAVAWTMRCTTRYRLPEPSRWAHRLAS